MSNRFHNKFHRQNHHSKNTSGYPDSSYDPIASYAAPFQGEFYSQGDILTTENLSAVKDIFARNGTLSNNLSVLNDLVVADTARIQGATQLNNTLTVSGATQLNNNLTVALNANIQGNLTISGNLSTLGNVSQLDTLVYVTSALSVTNSGTGPAATIIQTGAQDVAVFRDDSNTALIIKDGGNVGINTATPSERLDVNGNARFQGNTTITGNISAAGTVRVGTLNVGTTNDIVTRNSNNTLETRLINSQIWDTAAKFVSASDGSLTTNFLTKATNSNGINESIVFDDGTNVGINETSPEAKLHVKNSSAGTVTAHPSSVGVFESEGHAYLSLLSPSSRFSGVVMGSPGDNYAAYMSWNHDNGDLKVATSHPGADIQFLVGEEAEAMRIATNGNVGVGTITPNEKLTVAGGVSATGDISTRGRFLSAGVDIATLFGGGGGAGIDAGVRALTGNWQSTYTTVLANSSTWDQDYMPLYTNIDTARFGSFTYLDPDVKASFDGPQSFPALAPFFIVEKDGSVSGLRAGSKDGVTVKQYFVQASNTALTDLRNTDTEYRPACLAANEHVGKIFDGNEHGILAEIVNSQNTNQRKLYWINIKNTLNPTLHDTFFDVTTAYSVHVNSTPLSSMGLHSPNGSLVYCPEKDLFITVSNPINFALTTKPVTYKLINRTTSTVLSSYTIVVGASGANVDHSPTANVLLKTSGTIAQVEANAGGSQRGQIRYYLEGDELYISNLMWLLVLGNSYVTPKYNSVFTYNFATSSFNSFYPFPHVYDDTTFTRVAPFFSYPDPSVGTFFWSSFGTTTYNLIRSPNNPNIVFTTNKSWSTETTQYCVQSYNIATSWKDVIIKPFETTTSPLAPISNYIVSIPKDASLLGKQLTRGRFITNNKISCLAYSNLIQQSTGSQKWIVSTIDDINQRRILLGLSALDLPSSVSLATEHLSLTSNAGFISIIDSTNATALSTEYFDQVNRRFVTVDFNTTSPNIQNNPSLPSNWITQIDTLLTATNPVYSLSGYTDWDFYLYNLNNIDYLCSYAYSNSNFMETGVCLLSTNFTTFNVVNNEFVFLFYHDPSALITAAIDGERNSNRTFKSGGIYKTTESGKDTAYIVYNTPFVNGLIGSFASKVNLTDNQLLTSARIFTDKQNSIFSPLGVHSTFGPYLMEAGLNSFAAFTLRYDDNTSILDTNTRILSSFNYVLTNGNIGTRTVSPFALTGGSRLDNSLYSLSIESAAGFIVYSSETPVFLNGSYYTLPTTTWDMNNSSYWLDTKPVSLASKTIKTYVVIRNNEAEIAFSTGTIPEDASTMFIGNIGTTTLGVSSSNIDNLTRLGKGLYVANDNSNVGIGTITPNEKLTVVGNILTTGKFLSGGIDIATLFGGGGTSFLPLTGGTISQNLEILGNLTVQGTTTQINTDVITTSAVTIDTDSTVTAFRITQRGSGDVLRVEDENPENSPFIINNVGNVGIAVSNPNEKLTVVGNISASGNIAAQSSTIPVSVTSITTSRTFSNSDTNKVFHLSGSTPLSAIFPSSLSDGFNVALMNTGTSTLHLSTNSPYKAIGNVLTDQYAGAYVYKANSEIFAVGGL